MGTFSIPYIDSVERPVHCKKDLLPVVLFLSLISGPSSTNQDQCFSSKAYSRSDIEFLKGQEITHVHHGNVADILRRENFTQLKEAIEAYTSIDYYKIKSGLKVAIYYLIKSSCKAMKGSFLISNQDRHATTIDDFFVSNGVV